MTFNFLTLQLQFSIAVILVLILRQFMKKLPKIYSYLLWILVFARLLCPFSIELEHGMMPQTNIVRTENYIDKTANTSYTINGNTVAVMQERIVETPEGDFITESNSGISKDTIHTILIALWIFGSAIILVYNSSALLILRGKLKDAKLLKDNIYLTEQIRTPFTLGIINPKIYLPTFLAPEERAYIICHEKVHAKRKDNLIKNIAFLLTAVYWFNPLSWIAFHFMEQDMEMSCDEEVLRKMGADIKKHYSQSLLDFAVGQQNRAFTPLTFGEVSVKQRVKNVLTKQGAKKWMGIIGIIIVLTAAMFVFTTRKEAERLAVPSYPLEEESISEIMKNCGLSYNLEPVEYTEDDYWERTGFGFRTISEEKLFLSISSIGEGSERGLFVTFPSPGEVNVETKVRESEDVLAFLAQLFGGFRYDRQIYEEFIKDYEKLEDEAYEWKKEIEGISCEITFAPKTSDDSAIYLKRAEFMTDAATFKEPQKAVLAKLPTAEAREFLRSWANAFVERDVDYIMAHTSENAQEKYIAAQLYDGTASFGWSSPWPWGDVPYQFAEITNDQATIYYYAQVSAPLVTVWTESLRYEQQENGEYWITDTEFKEYDAICTSEEYLNAYPDGMINETPVDYLTNGLGEALNSNAKQEGALESYLDLFQPETAAVHLLNLLRNENKVLVTEDSERASEGNSIVKIQFLEDGTHLYVRMIQPYGEDGIWIPQTADNVSEGTEETASTDFNILNEITFELPEELTIDAYNANVGFEGGCLFLPIVYEENDYTPRMWTSSGMVSRYTQSSLIEWKDQEIENIYLYYNHSSQEIVEKVDGLCAPALLVQCTHDLYTAGDLGEMEAEGIDTDSIEITSHYWYLYIARPDDEYGYVITLNQKNYTKEDILALGKTVRLLEN